MSLGSGITPMATLFFIMPTKALGELLAGASGQFKQRAELRLVRESDSTPGGVALGPLFSTKKRA